VTYAANRKVTMMVESRIASVAGVQPAASDDDKAKAEAEAVAAVQSHPNKGQFVQYLGPTNAVAAAEELKTRQPKLGEGGSFWSTVRVRKSKPSSR
jgi:uncharacterized membrane protein